jgi:hypothetical protein
MHVAPKCFISSPTHQSCNKNQTSMTHTVMRRCCQLSRHVILQKVHSCIHHEWQPLTVSSQFWGSCALYVSFCIIVYTPAHYYTPRTLVYILLYVLPRKLTSIRRMHTPRSMRTLLSSPSVARDQINSGMGIVILPHPMHLRQAFTQHKLGPLLNHPLRMQHALMSSPNACPPSYSTIA